MVETAWVDVGLVSDFAAGPIFATVACRTWPSAAQISPTIFFRCCKNENAANLSAARAHWTMQVRCYLSSLMH